MVYFNELNVSSILIPPFYTFHAPAVPTRKKRRDTVREESSDVSDADLSDGLDLGDWAHSEVKFNEGS